MNKIEKKNSGCGKNKMHYKKKEEKWAKIRKNLYRIKYNPISGLDNK